MYMKVNCMLEDLKFDLLGRTKSNKDVLEIVPQEAYNNYRLIIIILNAEPNLLYKVASYRSWEGFKLFFVEGVFTPLPPKFFFYFFLNKN